MACLNLASSRRLAAGRNSPGLNSRMGFASMSKPSAVAYAPLQAHARGRTTRLGGKGTVSPYAPLMRVASETFVATHRPPGSTFMDTRFVSVLFSLIDATSNDGVCARAGAENAETIINT